MTATLDRLENLTVGDGIDRYGREWGFNGGVPCAVENPVTGALCCRVTHQPGTQHIATDIGEGYSRVIATWRTEEEASIPAPPKEGDPVDEEPVAPEKQKFNPGDLIRFRNRRALLLVMGTREIPTSSGGTIEVLDLEGKRYRVVDERKVAPRKEGDEPTEEQMQWAVEYSATKRGDTRKTAFTQRRKFADERDFREVLKELELEDRPDGMSGSVQVRIPLNSGPNTTADQSVDVIRDWLEIAYHDIQLPEGWTFGNEGVPRVEAYRWDRARVS
jgi:hypothetical protein